MQSQGLSAPFWVRCWYILSFWYIMGNWSRLTAVAVAQTAHTILKVHGTLWFSCHVSLTTLSPSLSLCLCLHLGQHWNCLKKASAQNQISWKLGAATVLYQMLWWWWCQMLMICHDNDDDVDDSGDWHPNEDLPHGNLENQLQQSWLLLCLINS